MQHSEVEANTVNSDEALSIDELHRCLGHISHERAKFLIEKKLIEGVDLEAGSEASVCESCAWAKNTRKAVSKTCEGERCAAVGDEIHSDLWGPSPIETIGRKKYYISFTDDYSCYTSVYFLQGKDKACEFYRIYKAWLSTQYNI